MQGWNQSHIDKLKSSGFRVKLTSAPSKDRLVEVVSNGKTETVQFRKALIHEESILQQNCVQAFDLIYPKLKLRLYAIPNGGKRDTDEAERLVKEGVRHGVLDLFLSIPNQGYAGLYIEIKTESGRLSNYQKDFIEEMKEDYKCIVCRSVEEFLREIKAYLKSET